MTSIKTIQSRAKKIKMLALDVDGVLTDGSIIYDSKGCELKAFNVLDGMGLALLPEAAIKIVLITAKGSPAVLRRAKDIGALEVKQNRLDKGTCLLSIAKKYKVTKSQICFVGDDLLDISAMKYAGLAVAVSNASAETKKCADYITKLSGGRGAVREVIELILKAQNKWKKITEKYTG